jgi:hypothetical protein
MAPGAFNRQSQQPVTWDKLCEGRAAQGAACISLWPGEQLTVASPARAVAARKDDPLHILCDLLQADGAVPQRSLISVWRYP